jgi:hypothetical protein
MENYHGKPIEHWKDNAEEDYMTTPISVLKYITVLEEQANELRKRAFKKLVCDCDIKGAYEEWTVHLCKECEKERV